MVQQLQERPPFITFETVSVENREASIEQGHYVGKDVHMAYITPAGSKDRIERVVADWLPQLRADQEAGRIPDAWVRYYLEAYEAFKKGEAAPVDGIPLKDWPGLSPTQVKTLTSLHLLTVERIATANEETIARLGMGGRSLKQRAIDYLNAAQNVGKVAEEASSLRAELAAEKARNDDLATKVSILVAQMATLAPAQAQQSQPDGITAADILGDKL